MRELQLPSKQFEMQHSECKYGMVSVVDLTLHQAHHQLARQPPSLHWAAALASCCAACSSHFEVTKLQVQNPERVHGNYGAGFMTHGL